MIFSRGKDRFHLIYYVVDDKGWVQHSRLLYFTRYQNVYRFKFLSAGKFKILWKLGMLKKRYIFFSSWRTTHALLKVNPDIFTGSDFPYFMAAVTSHSNIGGGLDPLNPVSGREPKEAFNIAVNLLKKFKVVTVNSMILYELLSASLPEIIYCPNGVDTFFFTPARDKKYDPDYIRIGWVGKERGPKNYPIIERSRDKLESMRGFEFKIVKVPKHFKKAPLSAEQMRDFYRDIDFYLCASLNEGTPNPALEAGACGVPVVTTLVGNMRELIKPEANGFFIEPTVDSIERQFKTVKSMDSETYRRMSHNMRETIENNWSWEKRINNFILAFDALVRA